MSAAKSQTDRLYWLKYNPNEWQGMYCELTDEEYGLFHRAIAKLWATPGNRLSLDDLLTQLRVKPDSPRASVLKGLIGYGLKASEDGLLFVQAVDEAFASATDRQEQSRRASAARWSKGKPVTSAASPEDF